MTNDRLLTIEDLAKRWGVSVSKLRQTPKHMLPPEIVLPGDRLIRYRLKDVEGFEEARRKTTSPPPWLFPGKEPSSPIV